jgi:hypothetical protein
MICNLPEEVISKRYGVAQALQGAIDKARITEVPKSHDSCGKPAFVTSKYPSLVEVVQHGSMNVIIVGGSPPARRTANRSKDSTSYS